MNKCHPFSLLAGTIFLSTDYTHTTPLKGLSLFFPSFSLSRLDWRKLDGPLQLGTKVAAASGQLGLLAFHTMSIPTSEMILRTGNCWNSVGSYPQPLMSYGVKTTSPSSNPLYKMRKYVEPRTAFRMFHRSCKCLRLNSVGDGAAAALDLQEVEKLKHGHATNGHLDPNLVSKDGISHSRTDFIEEEAWNLLKKSVVYYCGNPIGTIAANDVSTSSVLNYDQVFIRDFIPSGVAFLLKGEYDIVRNFILYTLQLQSWEKTMDCYSPGQGLMPASFKVRTVPLDGDDSATEEILDPDFGEAAIGRVAPVDSGLWWIILLRAYGKCSGDLSVQERIDVQTGIKMILKLCLADGFDMFPTLLVTDGSCMIDRRMGIHGHPLEIQALFYSALLCAREMLAPDDSSADLFRALNNRLVALSFHIREYYWIDMKKLNIIYRYKTEEYSYDAVNKFNIYPDQIPSWLVEFMPNKGGYLIGNLQPAHMDFRFFSLGNLWSIVSSLATVDQSHAILDLIEVKWPELVAEMPLKICYPTLEGEEWRIITGSDPKNTPWSYHNGGSWPTLLWQLTMACIKMNRPGIAERAVEMAERRILGDKWPEYYDTKRGRFVGKQSRLFQTWSIAGYLVSKLLLAKPEAAKILINEEDSELVSAFSWMISSSPRRKRSRKPKQSFII